MIMVIILLWLDNPLVVFGRTASCRHFLPLHIQNTFTSRLAPAGFSATHTFLDCCQTGKLEQRKIEKEKRGKREREREGEGEGEGGTEREGEGERERGRV